MSARQMPRTKRGAVRQYNAIMRAYRRDYAGGGAFGFDWPTFNANRPADYAHVRAMQAAFASLPE